MGPKRSKRVTSKNVGNNNNVRRSQRVKKSYINLQSSFNDAELVSRIESDKNRSLVYMNADGNCLFRALSDQLYQDCGNLHAEVRSEVVDFLENQQSQFELFVVTDSDDTDDNEGARCYGDYIDRLRQDGTWGGNLELVAAATLYQRRITVYTTDLEMLVEPLLLNGEKQLSGPNLLLTYHDNEHYNSVRDVSVKLVPWKPLPTDAKHASDASPSDEENNVRNNQTPSGKPESTPHNSTTKRNDLCPCQSGLRYKKCCLAQAKKAARQKQSSNPLEAKSQGDESGGEDVRTGFRSLAI
jgi:OTU-like cysteine protease/SEC-C motif